MFTFLGFAALAVDISLITMSELQAQATADSASHAALVAMRHSILVDPTEDARAAAAFMVARNQVGLGTADLDAVRFGAYDRLNDTFCENCSDGYINAVQVELSREGGNAVNLLLAPIFGVMTHDVDADAITAQQERAIMLVQDFSCSMEEGAYPRPIDVSRYANHLFYEYMVRNAQQGDMLGATGYAEWAPSEGGGRATSVEGSAEYWNADAPPDPWGRLTLLDTAANLTYMRDRIAAICSPTHGCPLDALTYTTTEMIPPIQDIDAEGGIGRCTNPQIGMLQAVKQLAENTDSTYFRGMVVMSDGKFNCQGGNSGAISAANLAYDVHDVSIWTIGYSAGSLDADMMRAITRGFGFFQSSPDVADLPQMYATVAESLPTAIVD